MDNRRTLVVTDNDELGPALASILGDRRNEVTVVSDRDQALARGDFDKFDLIISNLTDRDGSTAQSLDDLRVKTLSRPEPLRPEGSDPGTVKAIRIDASRFVRHAYDSDELCRIIDNTLSCHLQHVEDERTSPHIHENIEFELPSDVCLMNGVLHYLIERVSRLGVIKPEHSNLFVALDEAFVNAVKHGNRNDPAKLVRITAQLSPHEAQFTVEDQGEGFDLHQIPDPRDPENLFKTSGRGVLLIYNIMDEVYYNERGNRVTMVKRPETRWPREQVGSLPESEDHGIKS